MDSRQEGQLTPPGPSGLPFLGSALARRRDPFGFTTRCAREYGDVVRINYPQQSFYQLSHPDYVEHVLVDNDRNYVKGDFFNKVLDPITGSGLLGSEGLEWRRQRQFVQPAFQPEQVFTHAETMQRFTTRLIEQWTDGEIRDIKADMSKLTLEIVAAALFGVDIRDMVSDVGTALTTVMAHSEQQSGKILSIPRRIPTPSNRRYNEALEMLDGIVASITEQHRRDSSHRADVLSMLLSAADDQDIDVTNQQLRDQIMTLLVAGHETTALAITYTLYLLARYPRVEAALYDEVRHLSSDDSPIEIAGSLDYTEKVVKESMRLYPPAHSVFREAVDDDTIGGYHIPQGATIKMSQWAIHRDPRFYTDAQAFHPERWVSDADGDSETDRHRFAYFPFGGGPRRCIGDRFALLEAKLVVAMIINSYHLELISEPPLDIAYTITTRPKNEIAMRVQKR